MGQNEIKKSRKNREKRSRFYCRTGLVFCNFLDCAPRKPDTGAFISLWIERRGSPMLSPPPQLAFARQCGTKAMSGHRDSILRALPEREHNLITRSKKTSPPIKSRPFVWPFTKRRTYVEFERKSACLKADIRQ